MSDLETRIISGKGVLKLDPNSDDFKNAKILIVYADVIREPRNKYLNKNWNPPKSRYATLNFMRDTYVIKSHAMEFPSEKLEFYPDPASQAMLAVDCAYRGVLQSFVNLEVALGLTVVSVINNIKDWKWQDLWFDEIKVVCYGDTAIQLNVQSIPYELCPDQIEHTRNPPPPPRDLPPPVPPGEPLGYPNPPVSEPYEGTDDNGDTVPYPDDTSTPPPPTGVGTPCTLGTLRLMVTSKTGSNPPATDPIAVAVQGLVGTSGFQLNVPAPGVISGYHQGANGEPCGAYQIRPIVSLGALTDILDVSFISFT